jgi:signal transduction histidine kinase
MNLENSEGAQLSAFMLLLFGFILIITGIGDLVKKTRLMLLSASSIPIIIIILFFTTRPYLLGQVIALSPYFFISISLFFIRREYSASLDMFVIGWGILLLVNVGSALGMIEFIYVEILAIFGKIVIFIGMINPRFSFLVDDLRRFLISGVPLVYQKESTDRVVFVKSISGRRSEELHWLKDQIVENTSKGIRTILISIYDLISPLDLRTSGISEEDIYLVRMLQGGRGPYTPFTEHVITMNDDISDLDVLISDILNFSNQRKIFSQIIIYNLSSIIHTHGWKRVYSFFISKIPQLKASNIFTYFFYYPDSHSDPSDIIKFERLADRILNI